MKSGASKTMALGVVAALMVLCEIGGTAAAIDVTIKEWDVPASAYPHDPAVAPDGSVWYTGQRGNVLGRFDPATGQIKQYPLPTASSGPHGLVADQQGSIWYTGNSAGLIGKLDPKTGHVTEYKMQTPPRETRTRHFSIRRERCGSRCKAATSLASSIRPPASLR